MRRTVLALFLGLAMICGCSDDDGENITDICTAKCGVDQDKCAKYYSFCLSKCKQVSADADKNYLSGCGLCVAKTFKYFIDSSGCAGPMNKGPTDVSCRASCFLPDGGMAY